MSQIKKGYKETEVGIIPEDWECFQWKDIARFQQGYQIFLEDQIKSQLPGYNRYLYITDFYSDSNMLYVEDSENYYHISNKDICIANTGASAGKAFRGQNGILSNNMFKVFMGSKINEDFAWCYFNSPQYGKQLEEHLNSAGQPHVGHKNMGNMRICLPKSLSEQQKIATALSDIDSLISLLEEQIQKKKNIKQGAMQQLLTGKRRLPGFAKSNKTKQTELGEIPEDWEIKSIGSICNNFSYGVGAEAIKYDGSNRYIRITDIDDESRIFKPDPLTSPSFITENSYVNEDDILIARTGNSVGKSYLFTENDGKLIFAGFLMRIHVCSENSKFIFFNTLLTRYKEWVVAESMRSGQPGINLGQIKTYLIACPSREEQKAIANFLSDMDTEINELESKLSKYRELKTGMMQQLLTGKIRLV